MMEEVKKCYERMNELIALSLSGFGTEEGVLKVLYNDGYSENVLAEAIYLAQIVVELRETGTCTMDNSFVTDELVDFICNQFDEIYTFGSEYEFFFFTSMDTYNEAYYEYLYCQAVEYFDTALLGAYISKGELCRFWELHHFVKAVELSKFDFLSADRKKQEMYLAYGYVCGQTTILTEGAVAYVDDLYEYIDDDMGDTIEEFKQYFASYDCDGSFEDYYNAFVDGFIEEMFCYGVY